MSVAVGEEWRLVRQQDECKLSSARMMVVVVVVVAWA
jgi:hypothetical protein